VHCRIGIICPVKSERSFIADRTFTRLRIPDYFVNDSFVTSLTTDESFQRIRVKGFFTRASASGNLVLPSSMLRTLR
jgi:hypothetical protein